MKKIVLSVILVSVLSSTLFAAGPTPLFLDATVADNFKVLFVPKVDSPPEINGDLSDPAWEKAFLVEDYNHCGYGARRYPFPKTESKMLWDKNYLYVAIRCYEDTPENMKKHIAQVGDKSKAIYSRDCLELHIDGNNDNATRFQIWFIDTGEKQIFWHYDFGWGILVNQNFGLSADWDYAVKQEKMSWVFEARISLENLQIKPEIGTMFGANPVRFRFTKSGVRDDGKKSDQVTQFLTWANQGGDHHDVRQFGKCILVDKMPASVEDGLKLTYPDLAKRTLMIQTQQGFDIFEKGKMHNLSYLDAVKKDLKGTEEIAVKAEEALAKDIKLAKSYLAKPIAENREKLDIVKKEIQQKTTVSVGELNKLRKELGDIGAIFDRSYWVLQRKLLLLGKLTYHSPKGNSEHIRVPIDELENNPNPESRQIPFVPWAKNWCKGTTKALIITAEGSSWNAYELKRRMDIDADIFYANARIPVGIGPKTDYYNEGIILYPKKKQNLDKLFRNKYDVIIFIDFSPASLPYDLQYELTGKLMNGTGVITFVPRLWTFAPKEKYKLVKDSNMSKTMPWHSMTQLVKTGKTDIALNGEEIDNFKRKLAPLDVPPVSRYKVGKGTCLNFWPGGNGYFFTSGLTPNTQQDPDELFQAEYYLSFATKLVLNAAGKQSDILVKEVICAKEGYHPGEKGTADLIIDGPVFDGEMEVVIRNKFGKIIKQSRKAIKKPNGSKQIVKVEIPGLNAGAYYVDTVLWKEKKRYGWASQGFSVSDKVKIAAATVAPSPVEKGKSAKVTVSTSKVMEGATLTIALRDTEKRVLWQKENIPIKGTQIVVNIPTKRTRQVMNKLDLQLLHKGTVLAVKTINIFVTGQDMDDFVILTDGGGVNYYASLRYMVLKSFGINMFEYAYNPVDIFGSGSDLCIRYWMTHSDKWNGGSLASPVRLKKIGETIRDYSKSMASRDGRFLSTGDDSGVAADFVTTYPNWILPFVDGLAKRYRKENEGLKNKIGVRQFLRKREINEGAFRYLLAQSNLQTFLNMKLQPGDFEIMIEAFKTAYANIAEFNRANGTDFKNFAGIKQEDLKKIKPIFDPDVIGFQDWLNKKYGTIASLNKAWGANEKSFETIVPGKVIPKLMKDKKYYAKLDKSRYLEDLFIGEMEVTGEAVRSVSSRIGVGQGAASFNNIIPEVLEHTDTFVPYLSDVNLEIGRSFPHRWVGQTLGVYGGKKVNVAARRQRVWHVLFSGGNFIWFWSASTGVLMGDLTMNPGRSGEMAEAMKEAKQGIAETLIRSKRQHDGIAILHSRASGHMSYIAKQFGTQGNSESSFQYLIEDLGLQYRYISSKNIEKGILKSKEFKVLLLPYSQILSDKEVKAIRAFVKKGGSVIADMRTGTFSETGTALTQGSLDELFGIKHTAISGKAIKGKLSLKMPSGLSCVTPGILADASVALTNKSKAYGNVENTPVLIVNNFGKGKALYLNFGLTCYNFLLDSDRLGGLRDAFFELINECGVKPEYAAISPDGEKIPGVEMAIFTRGAEKILTAEKKALQFEKYPIKSVIKLSQKYYVTDMRNRKYIGFTDRIPVEFTGLSCHVWSLLPYQVTDIKVSSLPKVSQGEDYPVTLLIKTVSGKPDKHVVRIDVIDPDGIKQVYSPKLDAIHGKLNYIHNVAVNDKTGKWSMNITDILSGISTTVNFNVLKK